MMRTYLYIAINNTGQEVKGEIEAVTVPDAIKALKDMGYFPTKINEKIPMNLSTALKTKNRLAGELSRQQNILQRENARRDDSTSKVDRSKVWENITKLSEELGVLKGKITVANIGIYPLLERMAELKSRIAYLQSLDKREDVEVSFVGRDNEKLTYRWNSFINQEKADTMIAELQAEINGLQDNVDSYNAIKTID